MFLKTGKKNADVSIVHSMINHWGVAYYLSQYITKKRKTNSIFVDNCTLIHI